jgi:protein phosphatase
LPHRVDYTCAGRTDVGIIRAGNEDNFLMVPEQGVFIVADGMGGHAAGEVASEMAVQAIAKNLEGVVGRSDAEAAHMMRLAIHQANAAIFRRTVEEPEKRGMGTTATALVVNQARYMIGQVGDSRAYLLRDGTLTQLTKDHSYVQEQVDAGYLTPEQARTHPYSNVITRCVGANSDVVPDIYVGTLCSGDLFVLASDGLTGMLEDEDLHRILETDNTPAQHVDILVNEGNRRGGLDNITVIIVRIDDLQEVTAS